MLKVYTNHSIILTLVFMMFACAKSKTKSNSIESSNTTSQIDKIEENFDNEQNEDYSKADTKEIELKEPTKTDQIYLISNFLSDGEVWKSDSDEEVLYKSGISPKYKGGKEQLTKRLFEIFNKEVTIPEITLQFQIHEQGIVPFIEYYPKYNKTRQVLDNLLNDFKNELRFESAKLNDGRPIYAVLATETFKNPDKEFLENNKYSDNYHGKIVPDGENENFDVWDYLTSNRWLYQNKYPAKFSKEDSKVVNIDFRSVKYKARLNINDSASEFGAVFYIPTGTSDNVFTKCWITKDGNIKGYPTTKVGGDFGFDTLKTIFFQKQ